MMIRSFPSITLHVKSAKLIIVFKEEKRKLFSPNKFRLPFFLHSVLLAGLLSECSTPRYIQDSHWSSSYITRLSLVESAKVWKYFHSVAPPALLCHKEPARHIQSPLLGALLLVGSLWHKGAYNRTFPCMEATY